MNRIFLVLTTLSNLSLGAVFILGWMVITPGVPGATGVPLSVHFLSGLAAVTLTLLVHAVVLTYFMGTGRWIEETSQAYRLPVDTRAENIRLKYRTLPGMVGCITLLIVTAAFGAASDPGAALDWPPAKVIHMTLACLSLLTNLAVSGLEYQSIQRNGQLIDEIMSQVRTIRQERGLEEKLPVA